jgi:L-asparaginase
VFTGAMRPQKLIDSDAAFNIGVAVGALNVIGAGVYVCMNGRLFEAGRVRRDGRTGHFVSL